jgi:hypothetical protein
MNRPVPSFRLLVLAALLGSAAPAVAQPEIGSLIDRHRGSVGTVRSEGREAARQVINTYGRCVARNRSQRAEAVLALPLLSEEQTREIDRFIGGEDRCLGNDLTQARFDFLTVLGAMAEWFVIERHGDVGLARAAGLAPGEAAGEQLARSGWESIATCIARGDPAAAFALVQSVPASDAERAAIAQLMPQLAPCLPRGQNSFNRSSLRAIVAAGLYRVLVVASAEPAATATGRN